MNSEDDLFYNDDDSAHEMDDDDDDFVEMGIEPEPTSTNEKTDVEVFLYEVLTTEQIVQHMVDCIKEVNTVVQVQHCEIENNPHRQMNDKCLLCDKSQNKDNVVLLLAWNTPLPGSVARQSLSNSKAHMTAYSYVVCVLPQLLMLQIYCTRL